MKPFDIELAKAGYPVCTRDGRSVRILCFDRAFKYPIVALISEGVSETIWIYSNKGESSIGGYSSFDLMMVGERKERWMNVYENNLGVVFGGVIHESEEKAKEHIKSGLAKYVSTIKVEYEE